MSRRYDSRTTIFSPEGRLYQVEYAMEAISHAGTALGILATDGIVLAAEKKTTSKLLESVSREKIYQIDEGICCAVAGITSDANNLIDYARLQAQRHLFRYTESMPVEQLVQNICNMKQGYTQYGGLRPFGVSFLYAGYDKIYGFQLYHSDPSGNYAGWKATCIGANSSNAQTLLKQDLDKDKEINLKEAKSLAIKVLSKTMDSTTLGSDKLEFATLSIVNGELTFHAFSDSEIEELLVQENAKSTSTTTTTSAIPNLKPYSNPSPLPTTTTSRILKKKKSIRDIGGEINLTAPSTFSAPAPLPMHAVGFCTAENYDLNALTRLLKEKKYQLMSFIADGLVHVRIPCAASTTSSGSLKDDVNGNGNVNAQALDQSTLDQSKQQSQTGDSDAFIFEDGTFVTWSASKEEIQELMNVIKPCQINPFDQLETESFDYFEDSHQHGGIASDTLVIGNDLPIQQAKLAFSSGLARSVKLSCLETSLDRHLLKNRDISRYLLLGKKLPIGRDAVLRNLGELFSLRGHVNLHSELLDYPDFCWSNHQMENYFTKISKNLDMSPRIAIFNKKLDYANQLAEVLRNHLHEQHSLKLEWCIILLIAVEIGFECLHYAERLGWISLPIKE